MKVYIAYDDCDQVGVYSSMKAARYALNESRLSVFGRSTGWLQNGSMCVRHVVGSTHEWDQWIETHKVQS